QSPFPDVRNDSPYFNAVEVVVTRNLMEAKDKINGVFAPAEPVSGADALLVIRALKSELQSYLRS
ncbi:MAG TPA: S-layer homology domain-containing protein, partial [bacterium]|nr:S-layer homology domain-containing protein [bacterium]